MKKLNILLLALIIFNINASAQNYDEIQKVEINAGFGFQQYKGDLGNGFFNANNVMYGVFSLGIDYRLTNFIGMKIQGTIGDYGYCQEAEIMASRVPQMVGHGDHHSDQNNVHFAPKEENLSSRLFTGMVAVQFHFSNGKMLSLNSKFKPSIYLGIGVNKITDIMQMECVNIGNYSSINTGMGLHYQISNHLFLGYNLGLGLFANDKLDFISEGSNDMYMQNSAVLVFGF